MIIGAGFGQIPAIKKAKELGLKVIALDKNPNAMGMNLADVALAIDVVDKEGAIQAAKKYNADGVMTMQTDLPVPTIGAVVDALGLKGSGLKTANDCSNKIMTRQLFDGKNIPQPKFRVVSNIKETRIAAEEIGYPCIVKAPDSSGSRGVTKAESQGDLQQAFAEAKKYARIDQILVEEYIDGIEIGAQTFSLNGKCELVLLHNDQLSNPPYMIPVGHSFPITGFTEEEQRKVNADIAKAVEALRITDGPSNVDLIIDKKDKKVKIIEIGARIGATCLPELVKYYTGIDWVEATIKTALNEKPNLIPQTARPVAALILQAPHNGIFDSYALNINEENHNLAEFEVTAQKGESVSVLEKGTDRIGKVICFGPSVAEAEKNCIKVADSTVFKIK